MPENQVRSKSIAVAIGSNERQGVKTNTNHMVKQRLCALYDEIFSHEGYGDLRVEVRLLRRQQKEVIIYCGKQYRYVVDYHNQNPSNTPSTLDSGRRINPERRRQSSPRDFKLERRMGGERRERRD